MKNLIETTIVFSLLFFASSLSGFEFKRTDNLVSYEYKIPSVNTDKNGIDFVVLYKSSSWEVRKSIPYNEVSIYMVDTNLERIEIEITGVLKKDLSLLDIGENKNNDLFLTGYDVYKNTPSGRKLTGVTQGLDIYRIDRATNVVNPVATSIPVSGIDDKVYVSYSNDNISICAVSSCYSVAPGFEPVKWDLTILDENLHLENSFEIVEAVFIDDNSVAAILRKKYDDRFSSDTESYDNYLKYYSAILTTGGIKSKPFEKYQIPYGLELYGKNVRFRLARDERSYKDLIQYEYSRMNLDGLINFGDNNLEGRIAWSGTYYLGGLLSLVTGAASEKLKFDGIDKRLESELKAVIKSCSTEYPYFYTKRYSIDREPLLYALHLGRIAEMIAKADNNGLIDGGDCLARLKNDMLSLEKTVEKAVGNESIYDLDYGYGYPFWADGANVPYNFKSGYVSGLIHMGEARKVELLLSSINDEITYRANKGEYIWNYWEGKGNNGWDGRVSVNTPSYVGNNDGKAHISYRSMDASAMISCYYSKCPEAIDGSVLDYFKLLTEKGYLLPSVNDLWWGHGNQKVALDINKIGVFGMTRSSTHWQLHSQIFVIDSMLK